MNRARKFSDRYQQRVRLPDGGWVKLRLVRPSDKDQLLNGFLNLSAHSRQKRFLGGKQSLSDTEVCYFTELDQVDHFALGVIELNAMGEEGDGVAIGRFIRLATDSESAEVALTVIDRAQGKGIGRILLEQLVAAAAERDIKRFRFECFRHNLEIQALVRKVCRVVDTNYDAEVMIAEANLPDDQRVANERVYDVLSGLFSLLRACTAATLEVPFSIGIEGVRRTLNTAFGQWNAVAVDHEVDST